jgi:hypothetical protein
MVDALRSFGCLLERCIIRQIGFDQSECIFAIAFTQPGDISLTAGARKVIENGDLMALAEQTICEIRANEAGTTSN